MEWSIIYNEQNALIEITVEGTIVSQQTAQMAMQRIKIARKENCNKFLIDYTDAVVGDSTIETYQFMTGLERLGITHQDSLAIVHSNDYVQHHFAETVAMSRGWSNIQYFSDREEAIDWLLARNP